MLLGPSGDRVDALETAVTTMLQMVVIDLSSKDDPNVIFETLNARGTPLEQSDLIKNFAVSEISKDKNEERDIWSGLDDKWWRDEVTQGRLSRPRLDMLLNYWLAMRTGSEVGPSKVFDVFRSYTSERRIVDVMSGVKRDMSYYRRFITEKRTPEEDQFYYRTIGVMKAGVITPALLLLLSANHDARIGAFRALESFLVRRMICRQTTKDYNRLTLDLASKLREDGLDNADKVVAGFLKEQTAYSRGMAKRCDRGRCPGVLISLSSADEGAVEARARRSREQIAFNESRTTGRSEEPDDRAPDAGELGETKLATARR